MNGLMSAYCTCEMSTVATILQLLPKPFSTPVSIVGRRKSTVAIPCAFVDAVRKAYATPLLSTTSKLTSFWATGAPLKITVAVAMTSCCGPK